MVAAPAVRGPLQLADPVDQSGQRNISFERRKVLRTRLRNTLLAGVPPQQFLELFRVRADLHGFGRRPAAHSTIASMERGCRALRRNAAWLQPSPANRRSSAFPCRGTPALDCLLCARGCSQRQTFRNDAGDAGGRGGPVRCDQHILNIAGIEGIRRPYVSQQRRILQYTAIVGPQQDVFDQFGGNGELLRPAADDCTVSGVWGGRAMSAFAAPGVNCRSLRFRGDRHGLTRRFRLAPPRSPPCLRVLRHVRTLAFASDPGLRIRKHRRRSETRVHMLAHAASQTA